REIFGLSGMLEAEFGISLDKKWQRANWGIRPIPPAQLAYARMDSHFLIPLRNCLKQKLIEVDRLELAEEDFSRLERTPIPQISGEKENCWKISGRQDLTSRQLAVLCRLYEYREEQAKKANLPPFKILSTDTLAAIALVSPTSVEELENIPGLTPLLQKRYGAGLLETIALGQRSEPPRRPNHTRKDDDLIQRVDALKSWRKKTAAEMHVESDVILPREIVEQIYTVNPRTLSELAAIMDNFPLRLQKFGPEILQAVKPKETE
ncbi:MAG TPA: HRDC domain-containing protein, partial [Leptolinea sp.]